MKINGGFISGKYRKTRGIAIGYPGPDDPERFNEAFSKVSGHVEILQRRGGSLCIIEFLSHLIPDELLNSVERERDLPANSNIIAFQRLFQPLLDYINQLLEKADVWTEDNQKENK